MFEKKVLYGWKYESIEEKIREMLSMSLGERYEAGIATRKLARLLKKNQDRLDEPKTFRSIQVLKQT